MDSEDMGFRPPDGGTASSGDPSPQPPPGPGHAGGPPVPPYAGQGSPYGAQPGRRSVRASELRPRRWWLVVAALIAVGGVTAGIWLFVSGIIEAIPRHTFAAGQTVTVHLDRNPQPGIFGTDGGTPQDRCYAQAPGGPQIAAEPTSRMDTVEVNGRQWIELSRLRLPAAGTYQVSCLPSDSNQNVRYGIGTPPSATIFLSIPLAIGAFLIGLVITIVVVVRRSSNRRRLLASDPRPF